MRTKRWLIWAALMFAGIAMATFIRPHERLLMQRSTKVPGISAVADPDYFGGLPPFTWFTDQQVGYYQRKSDRMVFYRRDLSSGKTIAVGSTWLSGTMLPIAPQVSPDGCYLLYRDASAKMTWTDGSHLARLPHGLSSHVYGPDVALWSPDSRQWIMFEWQPELDKGSPPTNPKRVWMGTAQSPSVAIPLAVSPQSPLSCLSDFVWSAALLPNGHLLVARNWNYDAQAKPMTRLDIVEVDLRAGGKVCRRYTIPLPSNTAVQNVVFSPSGDRIALRLVDDYVSPLAAWLHRYFPVWRSRARTVVNLWVCRADGREMHEVGHLVGKDAVEQAQKDDSPYYLNGTLLWLPDDKRLSFLFREALWTVPAD